MSNEPKKCQHCQQKIPLRADGKMVEHLRPKWIIGLRGKRKRGAMEKCPGSKT